MRVTTRDGDSDITSEPIVEGPKVILYDHTGQALKRVIGFSVDNRHRPGVSSRLPKTRPRP